MQCSAAVQADSSRQAAPPASGSQLHHYHHHQQLVAGYVAAKQCMQDSPSVSLRSHRSRKIVNKAGVRGSIVPSWPSSLRDAASTSAHSLPSRYSGRCSSCSTYHSNVWRLQNGGDLLQFLSAHPAESQSSRRTEIPLGNAGKFGRERTDPSPNWGAAGDIRLLIAEALRCDAGLGFVTQINASSIPTGLSAPILYSSPVTIGDGLNCY